MIWLKRNLLFVIGAVVALALLVFAGYYSTMGWKHKVVEGENLNAKYEELKRLNSQNPHPGFGKVDNIKLAHDQQTNIFNVLSQAAKYFQPPPAIPTPAGDATNINSSQFSAALRETLNQLTRAASGVGVQLPPDFKFSFSQQLRLLTFAPGSLEPLAVQLGEIKTLCDVMLQAKVNSLDSLQRARVSPDDEAGPQTDYLPLASTTNDLAVLTPYQITFRSFSPELAQVLAALANSPHALVVKGLNVEPAAATVTEPPSYAPVAPVVPVYPDRRVGVLPRTEAAGEMMLRMPGFGRGGMPGFGRGGPPPPAAPPQYYVAPAPAVKAGLPVLLNEKQLRITLLVQVVKLLPKK